MPNIRIILATLLVVAAIGAFTVNYLAGQIDSATDQTVAQSNGPKVGGPFELIDQNGTTVTEADFAGRHMLVFFGYTYCPDVCPITMQTVTTALDMLGPVADDVVPVFITVDPARDTPDILKDYIGHFHERMVGLTGSEQQVEAVVKAYGVYRAKAPGWEDDPEGYLVDHTSITYLMGPDSRYVAHFSHGATADDIAAGIRRVLADG